MLLNDGNVNVLRGLAWMLPLAVTEQNNADISRALAKLCETSLKKLPGIGPRLPKLANAAASTCRKSARFEAGA